MNTGLYIGRFQPFHNGHYRVIKKAMEELDKLIIGIGSFNSKISVTNPLEGKERIEILLEVTKYSMGKCEIIGIPDINDNERWVKHVENIVGGFDVVYVGYDDNQKLFENAGYKVNGLNRWNDISASSVREKVIKGENWKEMVPNLVVKYLDSINFEKRLKDLAN